MFEIQPRDIRRIMGERPALGELLLRAFIARRELLVASGFQGLRVIGSGSSRDTFRIRDFLARNQVPFTWIDMDHDPQVGDCCKASGSAKSTRPWSYSAPSRCCGIPRRAPWPTSSESDGR